MRPVSVLCAVVLPQGIAYPMYSDIFAVSLGVRWRGWKFVLSVLQVMAVRAC
jgi:hypothetical protein